MQTPLVQNLSGRLGGKSAGYDIHATWDGHTLSGRIGAPHPRTGQDIHFQVSAGQVRGRVGGRSAGFDVVGSLGPQGGTLRLGGAHIGDDLRLTLGGGEAHGRYSGDVLGKDVGLSLRGGTLSGRIGAPHPGDGKDVQLSVGETPLGVAALVAVCAFKALEDASQAGSG